MNIVVDTSVWSRTLRRRRVDADDPYVAAFRRRLDAGDGVFLVGLILQELLDGTASERDWGRLLEALEPFPLLDVDRGTHILAARLGAACRRKAVQAGTVDLLIAAACVENGFPLLTADKDFLPISRHCELIVLPPLRPAETW